MRILIFLIVMWSRHNRDIDQLAYKASELAGLIAFSQRVQAQVEKDTDH